MLRTSILAFFCSLLLFSPLFAQDTCKETAGTLSRETYTSSLLTAKMVYSVYLPPCYDSQAEMYPVMYLMHGSNDDDQQWQRLGIVNELDRGIVLGDLPPVVVIMPFGDWIANRNTFGTQSWGEIFLKELMPFVESHYRIDAVREKRALGGISRGGFWAYNIALRHPELFASVGGHSAYFDVGGLPEDADPLELISTAPDIDTLRFWMDRGALDFAANGLDKMADRMTARGLDYRYTVFPEGSHNNAYWSQHLREYLQFYAAPWLDEAAPTQDKTQADESVESFMFFVPAVAFPSLQTTLTSERLSALVEGEMDNKLLIDTATFEQLKQHGVFLHPDTATIEADALYNRLWRDRTLYTLLPFDRLTTRYRALWIDNIHPVDYADYPLMFPDVTGNFRPDHLTRITLSGVTALTRETTKALDEHSIEWAGEAIRPYVTRSDFFHISNEVSIYPTCPQTTDVLLGGSSSFCSKPEHFNLFTYLGVDIVELTGNHNNDYGYDAYLDTVQYYRDHDIMTVGGGEDVDSARQPLILNHHNNSVAWIACNAIGPYYALANTDPDAAGGVRPGAAFCDWKWLEAAIPVLAAQHDIMIVTIQHQEYEEYLPTAAQENDFRRLADLGADIVIGTAPHKPQTFAYYGTNRGSEAFLHYGLGNLFFDQPFWGNMRFFMDTLYLYEGQLVAVDVFPGIIDELARPRLMTPDERENFLHFMFVQQNGF